MQIDKQRLKEKSASGKNYKHNIYTMGGGFEGLNPMKADIGRSDAPDAEKSFSDLQKELLKYCRVQERMYQTQCLRYQRKN